MSLKHLNDEEIQEYLDGNLAPQSVMSIEEHLERCPVCREALKQYQFLFDGLAQDEGFSLSGSFAKTFVSKLPAETQAESHFNYANMFWVILGVAIGVGTIVKFMDLKAWGEAIYKTLFPQYGFGSMFLASVKSFLVILNGNVGLVIAAGLALSVFATLDRFILQPRYRRI